MSNQKSSLITHIYKSRINILQILQEQQYNTDDYISFSINEVNIMNNNDQLDMILQKREGETDGLRDDNSKQKIYIKYYISKTFRPLNLTDIVEKIFHIEELLTKNDTLLIIIKEEINENIMNLTRELWERENIFVIIINIKRLQFNILKHELVPKHIILKQDELIEVKKRYNINDDELFPKISRFDPVAQVIGIRPRQVCKIIRPSKTAVETTYYRICV